MVTNRLKQLKLNPCKQTDTLTNLHDVFVHNADVWGLSMVGEDTALIRQPEPSRTVDPKGMHCTREQHSYLVPFSVVQ